MVGPKRLAIPWVVTTTMERRVVAGQNSDERRGNPRLHSGRNAAKRAHGVRPLENIRRGLAVVAEHGRARGMSIPWSSPIRTKRARSWIRATMSAKAFNAHDSLPKFTYIGFAPAIHEA